MPKKFNLTALAFLFLLAASSCWAGISVTPPNPAQGQVFKVSFKGGEGALELTFDGKTFPMWRENDQWHGLCPVHRDAGTGKKRLAVVEKATNKEVASTAVAVGKTKFDVQKLNVDQSKVTLSPEDLARAERERAIIAEAISVVSDEKLWRSFGYPIKGRVSGTFGSQRIYNGIAGSYHGGLDLAGAKGTPVMASSGGRVVLVGDFFYTGYSAFVDHGYGVITGYFHMDKLLVDQWQIVTPQTALGEVGSTGRSTGPHLHWNTYVGGTKVDPASLVKLTGGEGL